VAGHSDRPFFFIQIFMQKPFDKSNWKDALFVFVIIATAIFLFFGMSGCNPIKRVLSNQAKRDQMAAEIIKLGYCINDTTIVEIHDTTMTTDTIDVPVIITDTLIQNDTLIIWETKFKDIIKTRVITRQVNQVVVDSAKVQVLTRELAQTKAALADSNVRRKQWRTQFGAAFSALIFAMISIVILIKYRK
jgi:hypothetical protein